MNDFSFNFDAFLKHTPKKPGVYCMKDQNEKVLYVGKSKCLKKRLTSYFRDGTLARKTQALVKKIASIDCIVTANETEALLLEQTLIKKHKAPYNILLRDDKSYPYICLSAHSYPQLLLSRSKRNTKQHFFGPYPNAKAARESLKILQKIFKVRQCDDSYFSNRRRPCLQYQINRCKAPCVRYVSEEAYAEDVKHSVQFLKGKSQVLIQMLVQKMDEASDVTAYERAAAYRDQIQELQKTQSHQTVDLGAGSVDAVGIVIKDNKSCIDIVMIRGGQVLGHQHFSLPIPWERRVCEVLSTFLSQFYISHYEKRNFPKEILIPVKIEECKNLEQAIQKIAKKKVQIKYNVREQRTHWLRMAENNAAQALARDLSEKVNMLQRFQALQAGLGLDALPERIECFDVSHMQGEGTVASCVVFNHEGPVLSAYRRFNIKNITPGDDYAALKQVMNRRYRRLLAGDDSGCPEVILIDGGHGQLSAVMEVIHCVSASLHIFGISKGQERKSGREIIINAKTAMVHYFDFHHPGFLLMQHIRDEAHRFALLGHRAKRDKTRTTSALEKIEGVGVKRRAALIKFFGGLQGVYEATVDDLIKVEGIHRKLAEAIYGVLHAFKR